MKKNLHPVSQKVVFEDMVTKQQFLVESTIQTSDTVLWADGNTYPLVKVEISSSSHPAFTGEERVEIPSSRRDDFEKKYSKREPLH